MATAVEQATDLPEEDAGAGGMDMGTIFGILAGIALIATAIFRGGSADVFINVNAMFIVVGGTIATSFIAFPSNKILSMFPVIVKLLFRVLPANTTLCCAGRLIDLWILSGPVASGCKFLHPSNLIIGVANRLTIQS